jgi:Domain of unknown function (DUF4262)
LGLFYRPRYSFRHPEVILLGLPLQSCMSVLNVIGTEVKEGKRYEPGTDYSDILQEPYKCTFREVHPTHYRNYVGYALWFYENDAFPLLQCFWPDKAGRYPWDEGCNDYVAPHSLSYSCLRPLTERRSKTATKTEPWKCRGVESMESPKAGFPPLYVGI